MKKQILGTVILVAVFVFAACNKYEPKSVKLSTLNDSVNYTLGLANGDGIKKYMMQNDSSDKAIVALITALDKAYNNNASEDELYKLGLQIGSSFKSMKKTGLMGDSTLVFNQEILLQGIVNALNGSKEGMNSAQAEEYLRKTMTEIQSKKMGGAPQLQSQPQAEPAPAPAN
jgi:hypothetical protein